MSLTEPMPGLQVQASDGVIKLVGEFDLSNVDTFVTAVAERASRDGDVILDMSDLDFLDSTALQAIVTLATGLRRGEVILRSPSAMVVKLLRVTGVENMAPIRVERGQHP